jgi:serine/threonine protein kinase
MEWVPGHTLAELLKHVEARAEGLPWNLAAPMIHQICEALFALHSRQLIHRDLKPSNIIIQDDNTVKLVDLGIAKQFEGALPTDDLTTTGTVGTFDYMAPEQRACKGDVDQRADIYALGCIAYEMATGALPYGTFEPASKVNPTFPQTFDVLVGKMMKTKPGDRPESIAVVMKDLGLMLAQKEAAHSSENEAKCQLLIGSPAASLGVNAVVGQDGDTASATDNNESGSSTYEDPPSVEWPASIVILLLIAVIAQLLIFYCLYLVGRH